MYKKILVPFDNSELSNKALEHAFQLAKISHTYFNQNQNNESVNLTILHVVQEIPTSFPLIDRMVRTKTGERVTLSEYLQELYVQMRKGMEEIIHQKKEQYKSDGVQIDSIILSGDPSNKIIEFTGEGEVGLVVMGSAGLKGISKVFKGLGSVSRKVAERIDCPVLIIH